MANPSSPEAAPKVVSIKRFQIGVNVLIQTLVFIVIVAMLNYMSFRHFKRWDFSRDKKYALTSQTKNLLQTLKKPVKAIVFFSGPAEISPDVNALLREYEFAADQKFNTEVVDPYRNLSRAQELQSKYKFGSSENIVILDYEGKSKFVYAVDMAEYEKPDAMALMAGQTQTRLKAFKGEQAITSALLELVESKPNKIYYVDGHGEPSLGSPEMKAFTESLTRQNIQAEPLILLNANKIPEDCRALVICGPKRNLSEFEVELLKSYWAKNGRIFVLLNPFADTPLLANFLAAQAIIPQGDRVLRTRPYLEKDADGKPQVVNGIIGDAIYTVLDSKTKITKDLAGVSNQFLGATQSLATDKAEEKISKLKVTPLMQSSEGFWGETEYSGGDKPVFFDPKKDHVGPLVLAAAVEKGGVEDQRVKMESSRMVVMGNAEYLGINTFRASGGLSMDFSINALNWLLNREEISGIAPKEKRNSTLSLNEEQIGSIGVMVMGFIPGIVAIFGLLNWWQRRS